MSLVLQFAIIFQIRCYLSQLRRCGRRFRFPAPFDRRLFRGGGGRRFFRGFFRGRRFFRRFLGGARGFGRVSARIAEGDALLVQEVDDLILFEFDAGLKKEERIK